MDAKKNFVQSVLKSKKETEGKLQGYGKRIRNNIVQGHQDHASGKMKYYGTINPFK